MLGGFESCTLGYTYSCGLRVPSRSASKQSGAEHDGMWDGGGGRFWVVVPGLTRGDVKTADLEQDSEASQAREQKRKSDE